MRRPAALLASLAFFVVAPGTVAGLIPLSLALGETHDVPMWLRLPGALLMGAGLWLLVECFLRFALQGLGTPAPVAPTERLVVNGPYRRVRNPMYVAVVTIILGEAAWFADLRLLAYAAVVWLAFHLFVLLYEEPTLKRRFPGDYPAYFAAVPRWRPRLRPWREG